jgi:hypothetical protein
MNIQDTVRTAVGEDISRSYSNYVDQAVTALMRREEEIKRRLTAYATRRGLRPRESNDILNEVGLTDTVLADTARAASETSSAVLRAVEQLNQQVADLNRRVQSL